MLRSLSRWSPGTKRTWGGGLVERKKSMGNFESVEKKDGELDTALEGRCYITFNKKLPDFRTKPRC